MDERQIYGVFAFLGDVGGFIQILTIFGVLMISNSTKYKYFSSILNKMFNVK